MDAIFELVVHELSSDLDKPVTRLNQVVLCQSGVVVKGEWSSFSVLNCCHLVIIVWATFSKS